MIRRLAAVLESEKEYLARIIAEEVGRPIKLGLYEIDRCISLCNYYASKSASFLKAEVVKTEYEKSYICFEPMGTVLVISPWNYPFWLALRPIIPALCAGNTVLLKHSNTVPRCTLALASLLKKSGLERACSVLMTDSDNILSLLDTQLVDEVAFIGGTDTGRIVGAAAGRNIRPSVLELGGSDSFIILEDADITRAAKEGVESRMFNSGQNCDSAKRFIVVDKVAHKFEQAFMEKTMALNVGNPLLEGIDIGPLINEQAVVEMEKIVKDAVSKGAKILCGGHRTGVKGFFFMPTVLSGVTKEMRVANEEVFGPIAPIIVVKDAAEAIKVANESSYGLGASIWTGDIRKGELIARQVRAGTVCVNHKVRSDYRFPFGGVKNSGYGRNLGHAGIKEFVNIKSVLIDK
jgi:succinate-semialdehyde dehydrogenase/glutarate-semialdehyde dehydrogenase